MVEKDMLPNLFLVGAPKCGTTTLHHWLSLHPDVFMSKIKEPAFFCKFGNVDWQGPGGDVFKKGIINDKMTYQSLFTATVTHRWIGEASSDYLWVERAPSRIAKQCGRNNTKIIIVVRNHVERAFSEYSHLIREGRESLDFISSLKKENERYNNQ